MLNDLTFLYGPNSAGKSCIVDALSLLKHLTLASIEWHKTEETAAKHGIGKNSRIGVELRAADLTLGHATSTASRRQRAIWNRHLEDGFDQSNFFKKIKNQKLQIEFCDKLSGLRVAVNSEPLFALRSNHVYFDDFGARSVQSVYDDLDVFGEFTLFRNNRLAADLFHSIFNLAGVGATAYTDHSICSSYKQIIDVSDDKIQIRGISFQIIDQYNGELVGLDYGVEQHLFPGYRAKSFKSRGRPSKKQREWMKLAHPDSYLYSAEQKKRSMLYWELKNATKEIDNAVEGLIMLLSDALDFSHIRGDRSLLKSAKPFYTKRSNYEAIDLLSPIVSEHSSADIKWYADCLASNAFSGFHETTSLTSIDFPNHCFEHYLKSLNHYKIFSIQVDLGTESKAHERQYTSSAVYLKVRQNGNLELDFEQVGSGLSFVFPILTSLWAADLTLVEQPELHLHPKAQCELGDVFIAASHYGHKAVIESHSEHLLLRVLRRLRESNSGKAISKELELDEERVAIYYFEPLGDGTTRVKRIRIDGHGELLDPWPGGFFSEREGELF